MQKVYGASAPTITISSSKPKVGSLLVRKGFRVEAVIMGGLEVEEEGNHPPVAAL